MHEAMNNSFQFYLIKHKYLIVHNSLSGGPFFYVRANWGSENGPGHRCAVWNELYSRVKKHDNVCDVLATIRPMAKHVSLPGMLFDISSFMLHKEPFGGTHNQQSMDLDSWRWSKHASRDHSMSRSSLKINRAGIKRRLSFHKCSSTPWWVLSILWEVLTSLRNVVCGDYKCTNFKHGFF